MRRQKHQRRFCMAFAASLGAIAAEVAGRSNSWKAIAAEAAGRFPTS